MELKMKIILNLIFLFFSTTSFANCFFEIKPQNVKVKWNAYKTPKKVAVLGEFKEFTFNSSKSADAIGSLKEATFKVDSTSVATGNPDRDKKIVNNFFTINGKAIDISGKFISLTNAQATALLKINEATKEVIFEMNQKDNLLNLSADINVLDFSLKDNLSKINLACKALHEGVTWPDVKIQLEISGEKKCN